MLYCIGHRPALPHPLESMLVRARTVTVSGACLALTNILNKVYSERSCLNMCPQQYSTILASLFQTEVFA